MDFLNLLIYFNIIGELIGGAIRGLTTCLDPVSIVDWGGRL